MGCFGKFLMFYISRYLCRSSVLLVKILHSQYAVTRLLLITCRDLIFVNETVRGNYWNKSGNIQTLAKFSHAVRNYLVIEKLFEGHNFEGIHSILNYVKISLEALDQFRLYYVSIPWINALCNAIYTSYNWVYISVFYCFYL